MIFYCLRQEDYIKLLQLVKMMNTSFYLEATTIRKFLETSLPIIGKSINGFICRKLTPNGIQIPELSLKINDNQLLHRPEKAMK